MKSSQTTRASVGDSNTFEMQKDLANVSLLVYATAMAGLTFPGTELLRYLSYTLPLISFFWYLSTPSRFFKRPNGILFISLYILLLLLPIMSGANITFLYIRDSWCIASMLIMYMTMFTFNTQHVRYMLYVNSAFLLCGLIISGKGIGLSLLTSASLGDKYDSNESFLGTVFALYFFKKKRGYDTALSILMCIFGGKRIALAACAVGFMFVVLGVYVIPHKKNILRGLFLAVLIFCALVGVNLSAIVEYAFSFFSALYSYGVEEFMAGRFLIGDYISNILYNRELGPLIIGSGAGMSDQIVTEITDGLTNNTHDDWLKIAFDYGLLGIFVFMFIVYNIFKTNAWTIGLGVTVVIFMLTDNLLIYVFFQFLVMAALAEFDEHTDTNPDESLVCN